MRTCYIHIGMHKTGTSSVQVSMAGYDDGRLAYLRLSDPNHSYDLMDMFLDEGRAAGWQPIPGGSLEAQRRRLFSEVEAQFAGNQKSFVISGEGLSLRFPPSRIETLCRYLRGHFERLVVIAYLREPYSFMASFMQELSKHDRDIFAMNYQDFFPLYRTRLEPWLAQVGAENMQFVLFERSALTGGDTVSDFAARVGADLPPVERAVQNISLSAEAVALGQYARLLGKRRYFPLSEGARSFVMREASGFGRTPLGLDLEKARTVLEAHRDEVQWAEEKLGRRFPAYEPKRNSKVLRNEREMVRYAQNCLPAFGVYLLKKPKMPKRLARRVRQIFRRLRGTAPF